MRFKRKRHQEGSFKKRGRDIPYIYQNRVYLGKKTKTNRWRCGF